MITAQPKLFVRSRKDGLSSRQLIDTKYQLFVMKQVTDISFKVAKLPGTRTF